MIVKWFLESYEGGEGYIAATVNKDPQGPYGNISHGSKETFQAFVYPYRYSSVRTEKSDPSLIELMNWVEEELKFRMRDDTGTKS